MSPLLMPTPRSSAAELEWAAVARDREVRKREAERARQELETRRRIEARLKAKQEAEGKARRESAENGEVVEQLVAVEGPLP